jgi:hypothetical protein
MFCPECQAEYRQGFTRCADCDVDLVYELPREPETGSPSGGHAVDGWESEGRVIWKGHDEASCVALCRQLMKADLPYRVAQIPESREAKMQVTWRYEIGVLETDYQRAKKLLGIEGEFEDACEGSGDQVCTEADVDEQYLAPEESPPGKAIRNVAFLKPWYPEDATVEIWAQDGDDISSGIQMALKENQIRCRLAGEEGVRKVFVLPEDQPRARQIVREIIEGVELT